MIGKHYRRYRAREFVDFLKVIERQGSDGLDVHLVMNNYAIHKITGVKAWPARRPHTCTSASRPPRRCCSTRSNGGSLN